MPLPSIDHETAEPQTLDEILYWHGGIVEALIDYRASVQRAIRSGSAVSARYVGMTDGDVDVHYDAQRSELDRLTILNLVASAEATIKNDFIRRVGGKLKDPLAKAYRDWHKTLSVKKKIRPDFDEGGILRVLKETKVMDNNIVGQFRECLQARHWVGHGRNFDKPDAIDRLDPDDVYDRANALLKALPK
jgi:hypothetical protein